MNLIFLISSLIIINYSCKPDIPLNEGFENDYYENNLVINLKEKISDSIYLGESYYNSLALNKIYIDNNYEPIWFSGKILNDKGIQLVELMKSVNQLGLRDNLYNTNALVVNLDSIKANNNDKEWLERKISETELFLTDSWLILALHLKKGMLDSNMKLTFSISSNDSLYVPYFQNAIARNRVVDDLVSLQPQSLVYISIQKGLNRFIDLKDVDKDKYEGPDYKTDSLTFRFWLKQYLTEEKLLNADDSIKDIKVKSAISVFQNLHGLKADSVIGINTFEALKISNKERFQKILINLEKLKKDSLIDSNYILINVPAYKLKVIGNKSTELQFKVIVGKRNHKSVELSSYVDEIIVFPYWHVPRKIAINEILPEIKKDQGEIQKKNYEIFDYTNKLVNASTIDWQNISEKDFKYFIRQDNGPRNALGLVKFNFPNKYAIYMHDTPFKNLFEKEIRTYSHGCVRLEKPFELASYLFQNGNFSIGPDSMNELISRGVNKHIKLTKHIPVYIRYYTVEGDDFGNLYFYKDVYKKDEEWSEALFNSIQKPPEKKDR